MEKRECPECGEVINGRVDKKFCSDMCRNAHNNKLNSDTTNFMRRINAILRRNRRILEQLLRGEKTTLAKQKLLDEGFNFRYFTYQTTTRKNTTYTFCYEYGFTPLENESLLLVKRKT
jgi:predicted nucleic acid-binding Zn ribbon protein